MLPKENAHAHTAMTALVRVTTARVARIPAAVVGSVAGGVGSWWAVGFTPVGARTRFLRVRWVWGAESPLEPLGAVLAAMMVAVDVGEQASAAPDLIW
jgi:hypothetical protein